VVGAGDGGAAGCPLAFKGVSSNSNGNSFGIYENNGDHTMNDDVMNTRQLSWFWSDSSTF
jgi:hypothetical protein